MLDNAFDKFSNIKGLIFHSDQGWQYQHAYYRNRLKEKGIIQSMSRKGNCYDNCIMVLKKNLNLSVLFQKPGWIYRLL